MIQTLFPLIRKRFNLVQLILFIIQNEWSERSDIAEKNDSCRMIHTLRVVKRQAILF